MEIAVSSCAEAICYRNEFLWICFVLSAVERFLGVLCGTYSAYFFSFHIVIAILSSQKIVGIDADLENSHIYTNNLSNILDSWKQHSTI
jgi:hypothetical protein